MTKTDQTTPEAELLSKVPDFAAHLWGLLQLPTPRNGRLYTIVVPFPNKNHIRSVSVKQQGKGCLNGRDNIFRGSRVKQQACYLASQVMEIVCRILGKQRPKAAQGWLPRSPSLQGRPANMLWYNLSSHTFSQYPRATIALMAA